MSLEINIQEFEDYIRVDVSGSRTRGREMEEASDLMHRIAEVCRASGIYRILSVSRVTGRIPILDAYQLAGRPEDFGWSRVYKLAVVDLDEESRRVTLFSEDVSVNRGFDAKVFDNEKEAEIWLLVSF
jgi:hypothetical protein